MTRPLLPLLVLLLCSCASRPGTAPDSPAPATAEITPQVRQLKLQPPLTHPVSVISLPSTPLLLVTNDEHAALFEVGSGWQVGKTVHLAPQGEPRRLPTDKPWESHQFVQRFTHWHAGTRSPFGVVQVGIGDHAFWWPERKDPMVRFKGETSTCLPFAASPDGSRVAMGVGGGQGCDKTVLRLVDPRTAEFVGPELKLPWVPHSVAVAPDGRRLVAGGSSSLLLPSTVVLVDGERGTVTPLPGSHTHYVHVAWSPSGSRLASAGSEKLRLWDPAAPDAAPVEVAEKDLTQLVFSPDGALLLAIKHSEALFFDAATGERREPRVPLPRQNLIGAAFSSDGSRVSFVHADGQLTVVELRAPAPKLPDQVPAWFARSGPVPPTPPPAMPPLESGGSLRCKVKLLGPRTAPLFMVLKPSPLEWDNARALEPRRVEVAADGTVELSDLPRVIWTGEIEAPGQARWTGTIDLRRRASSDLGDIWLRPAITFHGQVLDPEGRPAPGVQVEWRDRYRERETTTTDAQGRFKLDHIPEDSPGSVRARREDGALRSIEAKNLKPGLHEVELRLLPPSDPAVARIRVTGESGNPLEGVQVAVGGPRGLQFRPSDFGTTDANGRFVTDLLPKSIFHVQATIDGREHETKSFYRPLPAELLLQVPDAELVVFHPPAARVALFDPEQETLRDDEPPYVTHAEHDHVRFTSVPAGQWRVALMTASGLQGLTPVEVKASQKMRVQVPLSPGALVRGRVVDELTGAPVAGVAVQLDALGVPFYVREKLLMGGATTDAEGRFSLSGVREGRRALRLESPRHRSRFHLVHIPAGGTAEVGDVKLQPGEPLGALEEVFLRGFWSRPETGGSRVAVVRPPARGSLETGDLIVSVNGESASGMGAEEVFALMDRRPEATLVVERNGQRRQVAFPWQPAE